MRRTFPLLVLTAVAATACGGGHTVPAEWQLSPEPPQGTVLDLEVALGVPCNDLGGIGVLESSGSVQIQATVDRTTAECDAMFVTEWASVELSQPLGERDLTGCAPARDDTIRFGAEPLERCRPTG